jgi:hypothetical protein
MRKFYELHRNWPEFYCSITIKTISGSFLDYPFVYEDVFKKEYLKNFSVTKYSPGCVPDVLPNNYGWFIVSHRFADAILEIGGKIGVALTPVEDLIPDFCPIALRSYVLLSTDTVFDCLNLDSPELKWFDASRSVVKSYRSLELYGNRISPDAGFFGVSRVSAFVISSAVQNNLLSKNLTGFTFRECKII